MNVPPSDTSAFVRPYVVSWNLTYRCNLACEHCYLDAGPTPLVGSENFADRSELGTEECFRVIDEIAASLSLSEAEYEPCSAATGKVVLDAVMAREKRPRQNTLKYG